MLAEPAVERIWIFTTALQNDPCQPYFGSNSTTPNPHHPKLYRSNDVLSNVPYLAIWVVSRTIYFQNFLLVLRRLLGDERAGANRCAQMCDSYTCASAESPIMCKTHSYWSPSHTPNFSAVHPAVPEIQKKDAHMLICSCTLRIQMHVRTYLTSPFVKRLGNGPLTTYQSSAQSILPFPRYEKGVRTYRTIKFCRWTVECTPVHSTSLEQQLTQFSH